MSITREAVEIVAQEKNQPVLEVITALQSAAAHIGDEQTLDVLCEIKSQILDEVRA